jgi:hypothetical protein
MTDQRELDELIARTPPEPSPLDFEMTQRAAALRVARDVVPRGVTVDGTQAVAGGSIGDLLTVADWILTGLTQTDRDRYDTRVAEPDAVRYTPGEPADVLRALIKQINRDTHHSRYWMERYERGVWHPDETRQWLDSLIDVSWTPDASGPTPG